MYTEAFAIIKNGKVFSFIIEESQKADLLAATPDLQFIHFKWDLERPFYPSDFKFENGILTRITINI